MESGAVDEMFENRYGVSSDEAIALIATFFASEFPEFSQQKKVNHGAYFSLSYYHGNTEINLGSGRLQFEHSVKMDGKEYPLREFDERMDNVIVTSKKNILFTLDVLKRFLRK